MPRSAVFLEKRSYRMRRRMDAARLLPFLGFVLFFVPVLWPHPTRTAGGVLFVFIAWAVLIALSWAISRRLDPAEAEGGQAAGRPR